MAKTRGKKQSDDGPLTPSLEGSSSSPSSSSSTVSSSSSPSPPPFPKFFLGH